MVLYGTGTGYCWEQRVRQQRGELSGNVLYGTVTCHWWEQGV